MEHLNLLLEPHLLALLVSLVGTWGVTEIVKRWARSTVSKRDDWTPRAVAVLAGLGFGSATWPPDTTVEPWVFGLALGFSATTAHWALMAVIRWRWPEVARALTGRRP